MGDLLLRSLPMCLAPALIGRFRQSRVAMWRRYGRRSGVWGLCRKRNVGAGASDLELIYSTESSDGSVVFRFGTASEIAEYMASKEAESESEEFALVEDGTLEDNVVTGDEEEAVEGLADQVLETHLPSKIVEKNSLEIESEVAQVEDGTLDENIVSIGKEETVKGFADEVVNTNLCVEMQEDEKCGVQVGSNFVSDSFDLIWDEPFERPLIYGDIDGGVSMEKISGIENSMSNEIVVGRKKTVSTSEKIGDSGVAFEHTLGIKNVSDESRSVLGDNLECNLEEDNVKGSYADDFGGNVGEDYTYLENSVYSYKNADGDELQVSVADLDPMATEPDVEARLSLDEASSYVGKGEILSTSINESINSLKKENVAISETTDVLGFDSDSDGKMELSTVEKIRVLAENFGSDDQEIPVVNGAVTSNEEMAWDSDKKYVDLQKTITFEVNQENTRDDVSVVGQPSNNNIFNQKDSSQTSDTASSLTAIVPASLSSSKDGFSDKSIDTINMIQKTISIATTSINQEDSDGSISAIHVPSQLEKKNIVDERINFYSEEGFLSTTGIDNLNRSAEKATPTKELIKIGEANILRDSSTDISASKAAEQIPVRVAGREEEASSARLRLSVGAALLPKTLEALTGGEDAYFIAGETWFGVADGEGQWSLEGIDSGLYGHELMEYCRRIVCDSGCSLNNTREVLIRSTAEATLPGSATVLLANFDGQVLHASNIGDTGFVIVRNGAILSRSMPTIHDFHFPHQIQKGDDPLEFAEVYETELNEGDIIVAATDGLFDNMYDQEIASIVTKSLQANLIPEEVAAVLAVKAQEIGRSTSTRSPFADEAKAAGYAGFTGGKLDDVAVIVAVVLRIL